MIAFLRQHKIKLIIISLLGIWWLFNITENFIRVHRLQGEWRVFDSQTYTQAATFPDGFRLEYPASWSIGVFEKGGSHNLGALRVSFVKPVYLFFAETYLDVWWRRIDEPWTLDDARRWFLEEIAFSIPDAELELKGDGFEEITIGLENYTALRQQFEVLGRGEPQDVVVITIVQDEIFIFRFHAKNFNEQTKSVLDQILASLEIYE